MKYRIFSTKQENSKQILSELLECPKLEFIWYNSETKKYENVEESPENCTNPFLVIRLGKYKKILKCYIGGGISRFTEGHKFIKKDLENINDPYILLGKYNMLHNGCIFKTEEDLIDYLEQIKLPLHERKIRLEIDCLGTLYFRERIGNDLQICNISYYNKGDNNSNYYPLF